MNGSILYRLTVIILFAGSLTQVSAAGLSGHPGAFADVGLGLRSIGMGGAYSALAGDENAARWNPAMLTEVLGYNAGFTWTRQFSLIDYHYLAFAVPIERDRPGLGVGGYVVTAGDDVYRETTFALSAGVGAAKLKLPVPDLNFGVTVKMRTVNFGSNADGGDDRVTGDALGYGMDIGLHYRFTPAVSAALVMRDLVNDIKWSSSVRGDYCEGVPRRLVLAAAVEKEKLVLGMEYQPGLYGDVPDRMRVGGEFTLLGILRPRFGLAQDLASGDVNRWITLGLGIELTSSFLRPFRKVSVGYTHMLHEIDPTPRVGLAITW